MLAMMDLLEPSGSAEHTRLAGLQQADLACIHPFFTFMIHNFSGLFLAHVVKLLGFLDIASLKDI